MYNQTVYSGLVNVVPFWSSNLIQILGLGNEYNIAFNMILTELLKITTGTFSDTVLLLITMMIIIVFIGYKFGLNPNISLWTKNIIVLKGKECSNVNGYTVEYCEKIQALNNYLLYVKQIKNITYIDDINIIINDISNYKLTPQLYLNICRTKNDDETTFVSYELVSYAEDIFKFIEKIIKDHKKNLNSQIVLTGDETHKTISYPEPIHAINYYVSKHFDFPRLKCMKLTNQLSQDNRESTSNNSNSVNPLNSKPKSTTSLLNNYSYTLDNIVNFNLGKVYLTINRDNQQVNYFIKSTQVNCKDWLDEIVNDYNQNKNCRFKNKLVIIGKEDICYKAETYKQYYYSKYMWMLNWYLIEKLGYQNYECINGDEKLVQYKYVLEPLELFKIQEDLFLTVEKVNSNGHPDSNKKYNNSMDIIYTLYSNNLNIKNIIEEFTKDFDKYKNHSCSNKILYHFTYSGMENNQLVFNSRILSESNSERELFETFDNIYNEHVETFKRDINKLKDLEYYKSHGLKRKKGYLFHGIPGCGKTSSVVAMALYDSRHIVEIPFSLLTTHQEFEKIMNLRSINNIEISNNNVIILFDEIDIGMEKIGSRTNESNIKDDNELNKICPVESVAKAIIKFDSDKTKKTTEQKLNLGTLLSKLDGIGNYNGLIVIGTTNYIDKLDPALYRELRLTPIKFDKLRKEDCIRILQSYFGSNYDEKLNDILVDRKIIPTKLIHLCQTHDGCTPEYFFNNILKNIMCLT